MTSVLENQANILLEMHLTELGIKFALPVTMTALQYCHPGSGVRVTVTFRVPYCV